MCFSYAAASSSEPRSPALESLTLIIQPPAYGSPLIYLCFVLFCCFVLGFFGGVVMLRERRASVHTATQEPERIASAQGTHTTTRKHNANLGGLLDERGVDLDDLAADGRVHVARRLFRFWFDVCFGFVR